MKQINLTILLLLVALMIGATGHDIFIYNNASKTSARIAFAIGKLEDALKKNGYNLIHTTRQKVLAETISIQIDSRQHKEGFTLSHQKKIHTIVGADESGVLYGCLQLIEQLNNEHQLPSKGSLMDAPEMVLRGECIGLQKSTYLPGRAVYEYPFTPETFPWFYDKKLWLQVLDSMLANRMNSLYLWNGHPFASLVKLKDYPYAVEVDDKTFKRNEEMYRFITSEADKRGIWVIQMFYNIIVSKPFAAYHKIKTQDRDRPIIPLIADYTRKSIAAFVEKYPNVGLMVCLGEAMEGVGNDDIEWFTKTIIPGVQDGLRALGKTTEPPIVLRAHDTDAPSVMKAALPLYHNLYTEAKFNGEALTTPTPRGEWAKLHQTLSSLGSVHIENVHIMANLEPFRYAAPLFIQQCVTGMHAVMGGNGLHLYPQASYWDWPYTADKTNGKRLLQIERDWIWYKAWARYAWKANRDIQGEVTYWSALLSSYYGCSMSDAKHILNACENAGQIAPKLLRRFGITDGNRQTLTLGMLMTQLINPYRYGLFTLLYDSEGPEGEMLVQYAEKDWKGEKHYGETPVQIINEVEAEGSQAVGEITLVTSQIKKNKDEFMRLENDMRCYKALAFHYAEKAEAALDVLRFKYSNNVEDLTKALPHLRQSVDHYKTLVDLTRPTYLYANSMQTQQRKIPVRGVNGTYKNWYEMLPVFENELKTFKYKIDSLKTSHEKIETKSISLKNASVTLTDLNYNRYTIDTLTSIFSDTSITAISYAKELKGLKGVQLSFHQQTEQGTELRFSNPQPVKVLVGYFNPDRMVLSNGLTFLKAPELETNAGANDYGQSEIKIANAMVIKGLPAINIHSYSFPTANNNILKLAKGICVVVGFIDDKDNLKPYDAGLTSTGTKKEIDWLFE